MNLSATSCLQLPACLALLISADTGQLTNSQRNTYLSWLDGSEAARYQKMARPETADCFLACRAVVRQVIASALGGAPQDVILTVSSAGKPECIANPSLAASATASVHFSITHKASAIAVAFSDTPIGVDLETVTSTDKILLARRFFTPREADDLTSKGAVARKHGFTRIWALKEAEVKRRGGTLAEQMGKLAFEVDGRSIRCHGNLNIGHYRLYQMNSKTKAGYLAIAGTLSPGKTLCSLRGLPLVGYSELPLTLVAESCQS